MQLSAHRITPQRTLKTCTVDQAINGSKTGGDAFWIDVSDYEEAELESWVGKVDLPAVVATRLLHLGQITQVLPLPRALLIELRVLPDPESTLPRQIAGLCIENLLITLEPRKLKRSKPDLELATPSVSGLLLALLLSNANQVSTELKKVRARLFDLDGRMDRDPTSVGLPEIIDAKDALLRIIAVAEEQLECYEGLSDSVSEVLDFSHLQGPLRLLLSTSGSSHRTAERLETRISDLQHRHANHQQERLNHRLAVLTVVSAVFLPLTLIAGIWGMNFEFMPELSHPLGYPLALSAMLLISGGMMVVFYLRGWFR
jgi:Mg2+ and Co2+ transporter CorA